MTAGSARPCCLSLPPAAPRGGEPRLEAVGRVHKLREEVPLATHAYRCSSCGGLNRVDPARAAPRCGRCHAALPTDGHPHDLTDDELERLVRSSPVPVLVDFYADWCGPCQVLGPILSDLATRHRGELIVAKVDTERNPRVAGALGVQGIPAVFLYEGGRVVDQATGLRPLEAWEQMVRPHLAA